MIYVIYYTAMINIWFMYNVSLVNFSFTLGYTFFQTKFFFFEHFYGAANSPSSRGVAVMIRGVQYCRTEINPASRSSKRALKCWTCWSTRSVSTLPLLSSMQLMLVPPVVLSGLMQYWHSAPWQSLCDCEDLHYLSTVFMFFINIIICYLLWLLSLSSFIHTVLHFFCAS